MWQSQVIHGKIILSAFKNFSSSLVLTYEMKKLFLLISNILSNSNMVGFLECGYY